MKRQKIVFYFTPDDGVKSRNSLWQEIGPSQSQSGFENKGRFAFEFSNKSPIVISANCNSIKSAQESTASITLAGIYGGIETSDIFFVNDYWEIWDEANNWCHFRGMVRSKNRTVTGGSKTLTLDLANAGWWVFADKSIFYINPILTGKFGAAKSTLFTGIKGKYGLIGKTNAEDLLKTKEVKEIFQKSTTPKKYLEFLVNNICNPRIGYIRNNYFTASNAIKEIVPEADDNFKDRQILISRRKSQVEGAVWDALKMFEGYPFCQLFIEEGEKNTRIKWRYSRWRDDSGLLCMGTLAKDIPPIVIYANDNEQIEDNEFKGVIQKIENETVTGVVNAYFLTPWSTAKLSSSLIQQMAAGADSTTLLDEDSILRNGYNPQELKIPFIPESIAGVTDAEFDEGTADSNKSTLNKRAETVGTELVSYSKALKKMYSNYKEAKSGTLIMKNNLPIQISKDIQLVEREIGSSKPIYTHMSLNKITQYFDASSPRTVLEYSRGFKGVNAQYGDLGSLSLSGVFV